MRKASLAVWALWIGLLLPLPAFAQADLAATTQSHFRKWDAGATFGFRPNNNGLLVPAAAWTLDVGRYWSAHLKTDASISRSHGERWLGFSSEDLPNGFRNSYRVVGPIGGSVGVTYQAFDNVFVHPYVSGGVRLESISNSQYTYACSATDCSNTTEQLPSSGMARLFIAGGFKSYFSGGRTFIRSELIAVGGSSGPAVMFRVGAGVDF